MNEIIKENTTLNSRFALTRKNQKGQVAIFVALIFQIIFVFFAILINVGLLVHHKINLQHSTDLAAYYGAMKQAENMNAIAHVNFQIRQAWKLLTWRYRVLGTFGFRQGDNTADNQHYPFELVSPSNQFTYFGSAPGGVAVDPNHPGGMVCNLPSGEKLGVQDIPFFCIGHGGFANWTASESMCQLNCNGFDAAREITKIPNAGNAMIGFGGNVSGSINGAIDKVNNSINGKCTLLGPTGATVLTRFIAGYVNEVYPRSKTIEALAANLSLEADKILDIEGNTIQKGSKATLENNLTEANLTSFRSSAANFKTENGLANNKCSFGNNGAGNSFLKKIEIEFIRYFIHNCTIDASGNNKFKPESVYNPATGLLGSAFNGISLQERQILEKLMIPGQQHTVGYEKNPHCVEYYAVKASSEPQIPFLPLAKIKLNALAIAKPFGGSIGPWYGKTWPKGNTESDYAPDNDQSKKTDETLPIRKLSQVGGGNALSQSVFSQPNFSLFVGDTKGLRNLDYLAAYHSALAMRDVGEYPGKVRTNQNPSTVSFNNKGAWPNYPNWDGLDNPLIPDFRDYDSMAANSIDGAQMRALEISAIAPNQFDITHYSIEPDFYTNYYKKLYNTGLQKILDATNRTGTIQLNELRADFGAARMRADQPEEAPLTIRTFSVKDQIYVKNIVLNSTPIVTNGMSAPNTGKTYRLILNYLISLQSSLLTSWTYFSFSDYSIFPGGLVDNSANTMSFGQCLDGWNNTSAGLSNPTSVENFKTPMDQKADLPPTPGNCVTGGRTGYSVKLISPNLIRDSSKLENPIDANFFNF